MKLLDLFCGAGGAGMGYHRAGFEVTGVDISPQPNYPFEFHRGDALEYLANNGHKYDVIHASPPCQRYSKATAFTGDPDSHPDLIAPTRDAIKRLGKAYVIENVAGARKELVNPIMLCGTMFGLLVIRHRYFEASPTIWFAPKTCQHLRKTVQWGHQPDPDKHYHAVYGHFSNIPFAKIAMGVDWMVKAKEIRESIPPAYTEFIGKRMLELIKAKVS